MNWMANIIIYSLLGLVAINSQNVNRGSYNNKNLFINNGINVTKVERFIREKNDKKEYIKNKGKQVDETLAKINFFYTEATRKVD